MKHPTANECVRMTSDLCKTPDSNGARSIAPRSLLAFRAEQCSALRKLASFAEVFKGVELIRMDGDATPLELMMFWDDDPA
jgi:hypothetical protein